MLIDRRGRSRRSRRFEAMPLFSGIGELTEPELPDRDGTHEPAFPEQSGGRENEIVRCIGHLPGDDVASAEMSTYRTSASMSEASVDHFRASPELPS
ncbi:hypothetical protein [Saccharothrix luteola]|uniref:hypothetical protein n=1 Tax=Saccharothrix luteola TaxID=2893018 RepID=UPI001E56DC71|nr:hypothetical protein [Saccharothrix luteola]MCC8251538.1 hypothetical protein [Saccharothrix luteola]